ncbi:magnesium transporter [Dysosmobacter sp.]|uniref:magnesium transporter n=1 Tax=Dysosmobacter sp. TaxID=2591382 RepID=UPI002A8A6656|nr:magnesium transporter [Dysosmobacter sp.]MDY3281288.1 magnesium transporter [Dysosmobacter sp.]
MNGRKNLEQQAVLTRQPDYREEIAAVIRSNLTPRLMREKLLGYHANDIAAVLDLLKREERFKVYRVLGPETLAEVLEYSECRREYLGELDFKKQAEILSLLETPTAVEYLRQVEKPARSALISLMADDVKREISLLSSFDEEEIGSRMTTNYIAVRAGIGVSQAMRELVEQAADNDNISTIYVVDEDETLLGAIDLKDLIIARETTPLSEITMTSYPYVYATEQTEDCLERIRDYSEDSVPVLDSENRLKGVLTAQDITRLIGEELGEDYALLAGLSAEEDLREPVRRSVGKRLPWLMVLLGLGILVSGVVGLFEHVVAHLALVVCFQSLVLDMAGNVGTQSLAVTIRVLMDEQVSSREKLYLVGKEARVGLTNGLVLGVLSFGVIGLYLMVLQGNPAVLSFSVSFCTGAALAVSMLLSSVAGTVVPILFKKMNVDPAVASGPLITTVNDLVAVVTYYGLAWMLLINVMGF